MPSFDIVSKTDMAEVDNAIAGIEREIGTRFDFKGAKCSLERKEQVITILADDNSKLSQMHDFLKVYFTRRKVDPKALDFSKTPEKASGNALRHEVTVKEGIAQDVAKTLIKAIKDSKIKVQASIQGDELRITGKKRDELQEVIALIRQQEVDQPLQFVNFRD
ncbi:YajQ family cyclic di-GMP-binding protein [Magnetospirillum sulfuroxidans]|uniref:Nucleotide-binding protein KEC16_04705 n=1 Tax=Magnetospirillum sulfuroxidans TaxID=611300 RepID=A0ABS5I999_9PROT|nr:YajQ family cyclic di-GMP-binding protein [Magnetospirillum sulfuroxidans]MBR9971008.1 YajQ family cyclic di-GMP-binding protein [Magnetospirillum sulfuroxidans]